MDKVDELNRKILDCLLGFKDSYSGDFKNISFRDYTNVDRTLGYSLGFDQINIDLSKDVLTLYIFLGDSFPADYESTSRYHVMGLKDISRQHPEVFDLFSSFRVVEVMDDDSVLSHFFTEIIIREDLVYHLYTTMFDGFLLKIRLTLRSGDSSKMRRFLQDLTQYIQGLP